MVLKELIVDRFPLLEGEVVLKRLIFTIGIT